MSDQTREPGHVGHVGHDGHGGHDGSPSRGHRRRLLETFTGVPATEGNQVDVLHNGDEIFPAMLDAIRASQHTIDFMTYVYWAGEVTERFSDALADRARAGVRVRVLLDGFGSNRMDPDQRRKMIDAGVKVEQFRPFPSTRLWELNMRTHRRVLVCDETVGFTGGVGIAQEWVDSSSDTGPPGWRDTHYRVRGPAVDGIHAAFLADWLEHDDELLGPEDRFPEHPQDGDSTVQVLRSQSEFGWNSMAIAIRGLLEVAEEHVRITSAYFRPPPPFRRALVATARRGVRVDVLVPGPHGEPAMHRLAGEHHYSELLAGGVDIHHYQPTMHHGKIVTVDGSVSLVGTTNFDARSLAMNEQVGLLIHDPEVARVLDEHFEADLRDSLRVNPDRWDERSWTRRIQQRVSHLATYPVRGVGAVR